MSCNKVDDKDDVKRIGSSTGRLKRFSDRQIALKCFNMYFLLP